MTKRFFACAWALTLACTPRAQPSPPSASSSAASSSAAAPSVASAVASSSNAATPHASAHAGQSAARAPTVLTITSDPSPLRITPIAGAALRDASAPRSSDGKYALEVEFDKWRVVAMPSRKLVARGSGMRAQWLSPTEIVFVDKNTVTKLDVAAAASAPPPDMPAKSASTQGGRACCQRGPGCGAMMDCAGDPNTRALLEWATPDLEHALVSATGFNMSGGLYDARPSGVVALMEAKGDLEVLAHAVSKKGAACTLAGVSGAGLVKVSPDGANGEPAKTNARLDCAAPAWGPVKRVADFEAEGPLGPFGLGAVYVRFASDDEVVVSIPGKASRDKLRHCIVTVATGASRCTAEPRGPWWPIDGTGGRFVVEQNRDVVTLIDVVRGRSWAIGDDRRARWDWPSSDARDPRNIVFGRADKHEVRAGIVTLPTP